jgi:hypothetical protein
MFGLLTGDATQLASVLKVVLLMPITQLNYKLKHHFLIKTRTLFGGSGHKFPELSQLVELFWYISI